jgi:hypothetical protein
MAVDVTLSTISTRLGAEFNAGGICSAAMVVRHVFPARCA